MRAGGDSGAADLSIPVIVFHGDRDAVVHPRKAAHLLAQRRRALGAAGIALRPVTTQGQASGGRHYTRVRYLDDGGVAQFEHWCVDGAGHAWSGGSPGGSYTDPQGPDAAYAMLRFFMTARPAITGRA